MQGSQRKVPVGNHCGRQKLERQRYRDFEVIVVDDGSSPPAEDLLAAFAPSFALSHARHASSRGIAAARNTGLACASGSTIIFLDDDMRVAPTLTYSMAVRMPFTSDCLMVGFGENASMERFVSCRPGRTSLAADWRCETHDRGSFLSLTASPGGRPPARRVCRLLDETADFRALGRGRVVGYWDLPQMVVGHTMAAKKERIVAACDASAPAGRGWASTTSCSARR